MALMWKSVDELYLNWLRANYESRIPQTNYGKNHYKPFFGSLFEIGDLIYLTQVSSYKPQKHQKMNKALDFYKIYNPVDNSLISVVNLNYMFPVHKSLVQNLQYKDIDKFRSFINLKEKSKYIGLLRLELQEINKLNLY